MEKQYRIYAFADAQKGDQGDSIIKTISARSALHAKAIFVREYRNARITHIDLEEEKVI